MRHCVSVRPIRNASHFNVEKKEHEQGLLMQQLRLTGGWATFALGWANGRYSGFNGLYVPPAGSPAMSRSFGCGRLPKLWRPFGRRTFCEDYLRKCHILGMEDR
eukprot:INCI8744.1.p1 GENE.INCI8744.1~~INCI8744.1.p1  ORF type:complete len:104 (+),score=4.94 INCI8744.1:167-478(+)